MEGGLAGDGAMMGIKIIPTMGDGAGMGIKIIPAMDDGAGVDFFVAPAWPAPSPPGSLDILQPYPSWVSFPTRIKKLKKKKVEQIFLVWICLYSMHVIIWIKARVMILFVWNILL